MTVAAQEVEFPVTPEQEPQIQLRGEIPELYFCQDLAGYGWCFRKGNYLNIGLGRSELARRFGARAVVLPVPARPG